MNILDKIYQNGIPFNTSSLKRVHFEGAQLSELEVEIIQFLYNSQSELITKRITISDFINVFLSVSPESFSKDDFNKLSENMKLALSMVYISSIYTKKLLLQSYAEVKIVQDENNTYRVGTKNLLQGAAIKAAYHLTLPKTNIHDKPLETVFNSLLGTKQTFLFLLEHFYNILRYKHSSLLSYRSYCILYESVRDENYERFSSIIFEWADKDIKIFLDIVELILPIIRNIELLINDTESQDFAHAQNYYKTIHPFGIFKFESSLTSFLLTVIIQYVSDEYLDYRINKYLLNNKIEGIDIEQFQMTLQHVLITWSRIIIYNFIKDSNGPNDGDNIIHLSNSEMQVVSPELKPKPKQREKKSPNYHIFVDEKPEVIEMLVKGLVEGYTIEDMGQVPSLVSTKRSTEFYDDMERKLAFFFTGDRENYNIETPYSLIWKGNTFYLYVLMQLIFNKKELLKADKIIKESNDPKDDLISKEHVKADFRGKNLWKEIEAVFGINPNSIKNSEPTIGKALEDTKLMVIKIAQFWLDCKKAGKN